MANTPGMILDRAHPLARGLVGWWPMNEGGGSGVGDIGPYSRHGLMTNVTQGMSSGWTGGPHGRAVAFDNSDDYIDTRSTIPVSLTGDLSFSVWLNVPDRSNYYMIVTKNQSSTSSNPFQMHLRQTTGYVWIGRGTAGVNTEANNSTAFPLNTWAHLCVTHNRVSSDFKFYYNGAINATVNVSIATITDAGTPVMIGRRVSDNFYFKGGMTNLRIYNRVLSDADAMTLYADPYAGALRSVRRFYSIAFRAAWASRANQILGGST